MFYHESKKHQTIRPTRLVREKMGNFQLLWILYTAIIASLLPLRVISDNNCETRNSCSECIKSPSCYWCLDPDPIWEDPRCLEISELGFGLCSSENIFNPENNHTNNINTENNGTSEIFQTQEFLFNPRDITVQLRLEKPYVIQFDYNHISRWNNLVSTVEMMYESSDNVQVEISCLDNRGLSSNSNKCDRSFSFGNIYHFQIELKLLKCGEIENSAIKINPKGISESLIINLEPLCGCSCDDSTHSTYVQNAPQCNSHGTFRCGSCICDSGPDGTKYFGPTCECLENEESDSKCVAVNTTEICSGRGACSCGTCICEDAADSGMQFTGTYCENEEPIQDITQDQTEVLLADQEMPQLEEESIEEFQDPRIYQQRIVSTCFAKTCRECIKSPSCSWCSDPSFQSRERCIQNSPYNQCAREFLFKPQGRETLLSRPGVPSYTPDLLKILKRSRIQLVPNQPAEFLFNYTHTQSKQLFLTISGATQVNVRLFVKCSIYDRQFTESNRCSQVQYRSTVQIKVTLDYTSCDYLPQSSWNQNITIRPAGINEVALIDLELICECPCEKQPASQYASICNNRGVYKCGVCECFPGFTGNFCEGSNIVQSSTCRPSPQFSLDCSGRGTCHLGKCICKRGYAGTYCEKLRATSRLLPEVRSFSAEIDPSQLEDDMDYDQLHVQVPMELCMSPYNGMNCSGVGTCHNGICYCYPGFDGDFCEKVVPSSNSPTHSQINPCLNPRDNKICSNNGVCRNDRCECPPEYIGTHCEIENRAPVVVVPVPINRCISPTNNRLCSERGDCRNDRCVCFDGFYGEFCDQYGSSLSSTTLQPLGSSCVAPGSNVECSSRGWCINNECQCASDRTGQYCEQISRPAQATNGCLNRSDNKICSGIGRCRNNRCECPPDNTGTFCENNYYPRPTPPPPTPPPRQPCLSPLNNRICSERGDCRNDRCVCFQGFYGEYCNYYNASLIVTTPRPQQTNPCILPGSTVECSGRGWCRNRVCECFAESTGRFCEQRRPTTLSFNLCLSPRTNSDCSGRGTCRNNTCICIANFSGKYCDEWVATPTTPVNRCYAPGSRIECSGTGYCREGRCICNPGFGGDYCQPGQILSTTSRPPTPSRNCLSPYNNLECSGRGTCRNDVCQCFPSAAGQYCEGSSTSNPCIDPQTRQTCSNNGQCLDNRCLCSIGHSGRYCEQSTNVPQNLCVNLSTGLICSGNGVCYNGRCVCNSGATGSVCDSKVPQLQSACTAPGSTVNCTRIGRCYQDTCYCPPEYTGKYCENSVSSPVPSNPDSCLSPYNHQECSGRGRCHEGKCQCTPVFTGTFCENPVQTQPTDPGTISPPENRNGCVYPNDRQDCLGRGTCYQNRCICNPGFVGQYCQDTETSNTSPIPRIDHCVNPAENTRRCSGRGECIDDRCRCQPYFTGTFCEVYQRPVPTPSTNGCINPRTNQECSGNGRCLNDQCGCLFQFSGRYCETLLTNITSIPIHPSYCRSSQDDQYECSGRGRCRNGQCECYEGFGGPLCETDMEAVTEPPPDANYCLDPYTQEECSRVGQCVNNRCQCPSGYSGQFCDQEPTPSYCRPPWDNQDCSQRGRCVNGRCECYEQFTGEFCEVQSPSSNSCRSIYSNLDCNGKGTCFNNQCRCDPGYQGQFCENAETDPIKPEYTLCISPFNGVECSGAGRCHNKRCLCSPGYSGTYCEAANDVPNQPSTSQSDEWCVNPKNNTICSGRGICNSGHCECQLRRDPREQISGQYCECDNYSCERTNGVLCSGRGNCECGSCRCPSGYSGQNCEICDLCNVQTTPRPPSTYNCGVYSSCKQCLESPTCAWCQDPNFRQPRCIALSDSSSDCQPEFLLNPDNSMLVVKAQPLLQGPNDGTKGVDQQPIRALINPQRIALKLRPHQPLQVSMHYSHKLKFFAYAKPSSVYLDHNATNTISIKFSTTCLNPGSQYRETNQCENVGVGDLIPFKIDLEVVQCPSDPRTWKQVIEIVPRGNDENLILDVELLCDCSCDRPGSDGYEENAPQCSYRGTLKCGACECLPNFEGQACERSSATSRPPIHPPTTPYTPTYYPTYPTTPPPYYPPSPPSSPRPYPTYPSPRPPPYYPPSPPASSSSNENHGCYYPGTDRECLGNGLCIVGRCQCHAPYAGTYCQERRDVSASQPQPYPPPKDCRSKTGCNECISDPTCSWCKDNLSCLPTASAASYCKSVHNPESAIEYIRPSTSSINPNYVSIVLRPGQPLRVPIEYKSKFSPTPWDRPFTVELAVNHSRYVSTKFFSNCLKPGGPLIETNSCDNVNLQDVIKFEVEFAILGGCPQEDEWFQKVQLHRVGLNDSLNVDVEFLCECSCDETGAKTEIQSPRCSYRGSFSCGECECDDGYTGDRCEVKFNDDEDEDGICVVGSNGLVCSGKGTCLNERCRCAIGWTGVDCSCPTSTSGCMNPQNNQICSGNGSCACGTCRCSPGFTGQFCQTCNSRACWQQHQQGQIQQPHVPQQQSWSFKDIETASETCAHLSSCDKCIQNPACNWCLDPNTSPNSCFARESSSFQCRPELVFDPHDSFVVVSYNTSSTGVDVGVSDILPERVNVTLRPGKPLRFSVDYTHGIFPFNNPSFVELEHSNPYGINVKFFSYCLDRSQPLRETNRCDGLQMRSTVRFYVELEAKSCPKNSYDWQQTIEIQPLHLPTVMAIDVKLLCNCGCSSSSNGGFVQNALECSQRGDLKCGTCECYPGYSGSNCQNLDNYQPEIAPLDHIIEIPNQNQTDDQTCTLKSSCHDCIQTTNCAWCNDPALIGSRRCYDPRITKPIGDRCRDDYVHNPDNTMQVVPSSPTTQLYARGEDNNFQRVYIKLRIGQPFMISLFYNHHPSANSWFRSTVELKHNGSQNAQLRFFTNCLNPDQPLTETTKCNNLEHSGLIEFKVEFRVEHCPRDQRDWKETLNISPVGSKEHFIIDLESICDCPCEHSEQLNYKNISRECNYQGTYACGVCECNPGYSGITCERYNDQTSLQSGQENGQQCSNSMQTCFSSGSSLMCSGHGTCNCGQCACELGYTGRYCEYCQGCNQTLPSVDKPPSSYEQCSSKTSCDVCIQTPSCAWCTDPNFRASYKCFQYANQSIYQCREEYVTNPTNNVTVLDVGHLTQVYTHLDQHQVFPKRLSLQIRPSAPHLLDLAVVVPQTATASSFLHMLHDSRGFLKIRYFTKCQSNVLKETAKCSSVQPGGVITFNVAIELLQCPRENREWKQTVRIYPSGGTESLSIDLDMLCDCSCSNAIKQAPQCSRRGTYKCGKCECDPHFTGANCGVQEQPPVSQAVCSISQEGCRNPFGRSPQEHRICSGRGECNCGTCNCHPHFTGFYCETYCPSCT